MAYQPILASVRTFLPLSKNDSNRSPPKICVPGAGVGRLAYEIAAMGYTVQGNEFSLYMLLASDFILNGPVVSVSSSLLECDENGKQQRHPLSISPWLLETRNVNAMIDPFRTVQIPDVDPLDMITLPSSIYIDDDTTATAVLPNVKSTKATKSADSTSVASLLDPSNVTPSVRDLGADFSMAAGDFSSIYSVDSEAGAWDCVAACFFLDASPNIVEYIQVIHHMLKPDGLLINFGPLHWHWSGPAMLLTDESIADYHDRYDHLDPKYLQSYDFCWEEIQTMLVNVGFEILEISTGNPAFYTSNQRSMLLTEYRCTNFVARKKMKMSHPLPTS
jgi:carnosine N-methyltransferase